MAQLAVDPVLALITGFAAMFLYYYGLRSSPAVAATLAELAFPFRRARRIFQVRPDPQRLAVVRVALTSTIVALLPRVPRMWHLRFRRRCPHEADGSAQGEPAWWLRDADDGDRSAPLDRDLEVDVAIVGGGFTGLWTALALRALPSRRAACSKPSSAAGAEWPERRLLSGYWSYLPTLRDLFGDEAALRLCAAGDRIIPGIRSFLADRGEDAWLREDGLLEVSAGPSQDGEIDGQVEAALEVGHPEEAELRESPGISPRFRRGVFFRDGATVHPARLVRALRRAALADGSS